MKGQWLYLLYRSLPLIVAIFLSNSNALAQANSGRLVVVHMIRAVMAIPSGWQYVPQMQYVGDMNEYNLYSGADGFARTWPIPGDFTLDEICQQQSAEITDAPAIETTEIAGQPACVITSSDSASAKRAVVHYPDDDFHDFAGDVHFIALETDSAHFDLLAASLSFDPSLVTPATYLEPVLDWIQQYSYFSNQVNWSGLRDYTMQQVEGETSLETAHKAILDTLVVLSSYGDHHSFFLNPEMALRFIQGRSLDNVEYPVEGDFKLPSGRRLNESTGYILLPGFVASNELQKTYVQAAQDVLREVDQSPTPCWVLDLRLNLGGSMEPMLLGVGSLIGNGRIGGFQLPDGKNLYLRLQDNQLFQDELPLPNIMPDQPYALKNAEPAVAVLQSGYTSSSGEITLIAFLGREHMRTFGELSGGYTTGNSGLMLYDGAGLALASSIEFDRNGMVYRTAITPDESIANDWEMFGTADDLVLGAALDWLETSAGCS